jgi:hypothetical protein
MLMSSNSEASVNPTTLRIHMYKSMNLVSNRSRLYTCTPPERKAGRALLQNICEYCAIPSLLTVAAVPVLRRCR